MGVPLMLPSVVLNVRPAGRSPLIDHVTTEPPLFVGVRCTGPCFVKVKLLPP
jgi:hypothetical protein